MSTSESVQRIDDMCAYRESKHLRPEHVAEAMRVELGEVTRHFTSVTKMEKQGSYKVNTIRAYANAVGLPFTVALEYFERLASQTSQEKKSKNV